MRILLTGSTAQQANPRSFSNMVNFTGLLSAWLRDRGHEVVWTQPSVSWDSSFLRTFDHVVVGVSSPLAMGASSLYGAFATIEALWGDPRLRLLLDAPDPGAVRRGLRSVDANWASFTKEFFSGRREYGEVVSDPRLQARLRMTARRLLDREWPETIVPVVPWASAGEVEKLLPPGAAGRVRPANLDRLLADWTSAAYRDPPFPEPLPRWATEKPAGRAQHKWLAAQNLAFRVEAAPSNHRVPMVGPSVRFLRESAGLLVPPGQNGLAWWTPRAVMAMTQGVPVFSDWKQTWRLGSSWAGLPAPYELVRPAARARLAARQLEDYLAIVDREAPGAGDLLPEPARRQRQTRKPA